MKKYKFMIMTQSYNPNIGGYVVLHKLCDELNALGYEAKVFPAFNNYVFNKNNIARPILRFLKERWRRLKEFKVNSSLSTPIGSEADLHKSLDDWIVVYPETISGNPLGARNVVRWFLHHPGFHVADYYFGLNELYFRYHSGIKVPELFAPFTAKEELHVVHYPLELYNMEGVADDRRGSAYAIRKGVGKKIIHDLKDSILIDGKSHEEISRIFKSVKTFYSYDPYTAYSTFAVLCGCDSVVIPDKGVSVDEWIPDSFHRAGFAYGVAEIETARAKRPDLLKRVESELSENKRCVQQFVSEVNSFFGSRSDR